MIFFQTGKHGDKLSDDHFGDLHLTRAVVEEGSRVLLLLKSYIYKITKKKHFYIRKYIIMLKSTNFNNKSSFKEKVWCLLKKVKIFKSTNFKSK